MVAVLLPALGPGPVNAAEEDEPAAPLTVDLTRLVPAAIPATGDVTLAGTVTNDSDETWIAVNVHPFISRSPMTTRDELAAATSTPVGVDVGTRLVEPGQFEPIGDLAPGTSRPFRISLPVEQLGAEITGDEGVYWFGVHALAQATDGSRAVQGRARTFIPLVSQPKTTTVAVVVPVRERVRRDANGRILGTTGWSDSLTPSGRLGRLGALLESSGSSPATLLIDPAVLEAVADLSADNPPLSLGDGEAAPSPSPSATESPSRSANRLEPTDRANAEAWVQQVTAATRRHVVLRLPYADPDVNTLARRAPSLLDLAGKLSEETFAALDISAVPAVAPPDGWLDDPLIPQIGEDTVVLLTDHGTPRTRTLWKTTTGEDLVLADQRAATGGPGPTVSTGALALRQRIVADASLRVGRVTSPLVVVLPDDWDPGPGWQLADFFSGLDLPWLDPVSLGRSSDPTTPTYDDGLGYPAAQRDQEVPQVNVDATRALLRTTDSLDQLLRSENDVAHELGGTALTAVSIHARGDRARARGQVLATNARMLSRVGKVEVLGTDFVTLSGGSGTLAVTLVNGLDQPVTVGVEAQTTASGVTIERTAPFAMAPGQRTVLRLKANAAGVGVNQVTLSAVTENGTALGTPLVFSLRTSQVGNLIWGILGAGALLLVVMIGIRIRRGLREHRWRRG